MANQSIISIVIKARDEASQVLKDVGVSASTLGLALAGIGAAGQAMTIAMTMTAARTEELGLIAQKMGEVHGYSAAQIDRAEESIKRLGITTQTARLLIAQLIGSQVGLAQATSIARAAQDLATLGAVDSSEATADLAYAIASLQPRLLRKYRIYISLVKVYRDAADALGKNILQLTETEKRVAFLNAVLQEAARYTGLYEEKMKTASGQLRSMQRYIQEAANTLGQVYIPAMKDAITVTNKFLEAVSKTEGALPRAAGLLLGMVTLFVALTGAGILLWPKLVAIAKGITALSIAAGIASTSVLGTIVTIVGMIVAVTGAIVAWKMYRDVVTKGSEDIVKAGVKAGKSYDEMAQAMRQAYAAMPLWKQVVLSLTGGMYVWIDRILGTREEYEHLYRVLSYTLPKTQEWQLALYDISKAWDEVRWAQGQAASSIEAVMQAYDKAFFSMAGFFGNATRATEHYQADMLTLRRRHDYLVAQAEEKGLTDSLQRQLEANEKAQHQLDVAHQRQREAMNRQLGMMLIAQVQAADIGVEAATRMSLAIAEAYDIAGPADVTKALRLFAPIFELERGLIPEEVAVRQLTAMAGGFQYGGIVPGPIGQPQLIVAHGGETVTPAGGGGVNITIGALYGTDRLAATRFGRQIGRDLLTLGVRTR